MNYPHADIELARRLERTEGAANAAFVDAHAELDPAFRVAYTRIKWRLG